MLFKISDGKAAEIMIQDCTENVLIIKLKFTNKLLVNEQKISWLQVDMFWNTKFELLSDKKV